MTKSLFVEQIQPEQLGRGLVPMYSLNGMPGYIDVGLLYVELGDPTGYKFAMSIFESWDHFQYISGLAWFRRHLTLWEDELAVKMRSEAIKSLSDTAKNDGNKGITAAKYIAEKGWEKKRGRPSKADVERERKQQARIRAELDEDAARLNVH